jgi:defect-in-organelle-trafficking protein DotC
MRKLFLATLLSASCLTGFADIDAQVSVDEDGRAVISANAINNLKNAKAEKFNAEVKNRNRILRYHGLQVGQQYGFALQLEHLQDALDTSTGSLNDIFNFNFILSYANEGSPAVNILPPVLLKAQNYIESQGGQSISIAHEHFTLFRQASLVTVVPTWRDYLIKAIPMPQEIPNAYLPHDELEQTIWQEAIDSGLILGIKQADEEMTYRINLLDRDFNGMLTYLRLQDAGKVTSPYVAYAHQSVVGNGQAMSVNQDVYRITSKSKLIINPNKWDFQPQDKI